MSRAHLPERGESVDLAVSGGPDSLGLLLLALEAGLVVRVHHVDHHARAASADDADFVVALCERLDVAFVRHDVIVDPGPNFEARARAARRAVLPDGVLTGHTMDDLAETVLLNMLRGAGLDGLSPMVDDPSKPLRDIRRSALHDYVAARGLAARHDETNDSADHLRNRVRHELVPLMRDLAGRDVVALLARQAALMHDERVWLDLLGAGDGVALADADCRELRDWPTARLRRWLRAQLRGDDRGDGTHPPTAEEVQRAIDVVRGDAVAAQLSGGRRLSRTGQHLTLE